MADQKVGFACSQESEQMKKLSRRDFLKLSGLAMGNLAFTPFFPDRGDRGIPRDLVRVAFPAVSVYQDALMDAAYIRDHYRDDLVNVYYRITPPEGPAYNPFWYRVWGGYMHSAYLQKVKVLFNNPLESVREGGHLAEVTVPFTQSFKFSRTFGWEQINRLYYSTTHWITGIEEGPGGETLYRFTDELQPVDYFAPAIHFRPILDEEFAPISPDLPFEAKRIEVSLQKQTLTAYENDQIVFFATVSTGIPSYQPGDNGIPTATPKGRFNIFSKMPSKHMGNARLTDNLDDYILMGVPWTCFFTQNGVALHGTFWHSNYGWPMSRGCVNLRPKDAKWLFRWTYPVSLPGDWEKRGYGTPVIVY
jgi:hypothetical protein